MKKLFSLFFIVALFSSSSFALVGEVDIGDNFLVKKENLEVVKSDVKTEINYVLVFDLKIDSMDLIVSELNRDFLSTLETEIKNLKHSEAERIQRQVRNTYNKTYKRPEATNRNLEFIHRCSFIL